MRPPRCYIRHTTAAIVALERAVRLLAYLPGPENVLAARYEALLAARIAVAELTDHIDDCEECETP